MKGASSPFTHSACPRTTQFAGVHSRLAFEVSVSSPVLVAAVLVVAPGVVAPGGRAGSGWRGSVLGAGPTCLVGAAPSPLGGATHGEQNTTHECVRAGAKCRLRTGTPNAFAACLHVLVRRASLPVPTQVQWGSFVREAVKGAAPCCGAEKCEGRGGRGGQKRWRQVRALACMHACGPDVRAHNTSRVHSHHVPRAVVSREGASSSLISLQGRTPIFQATMTRFAGRLTHGWGFHRLCWLRSCLLWRLALWRLVARLILVEEGTC